MRLRNIFILLAILAALGGYFYYANASRQEPKEEPKLFVWSIEMDDIRHIEIILPRDGKNQAFVKGEDRNWYFDNPQRSPVDIERWGGGIPLLLSGPGIDRVIAENTTAEQLTQFGLTQPRMQIILTLNNRTLNIKVGDETPDGSNFYIQAPGTNNVATVDYSWYDVIERLVTEPPYAKPAS